VEASLSRFPADEVSLYSEKGVGALRLHGNFTS
jgi:hypothetical protein